MCTYFSIEACEHLTRDGDGDEVHDGFEYEIEEMRKLANQQRTSVARIAALRKSQQRVEDSENSKTVRTLEQLEAQARRVDEFLLRCCRLVPLSSRPSKRGATQAGEVFDTPELLEHVLSFLPPADILTAQQVGRVWNAAVLGSRKLQAILCLTPEKDAVFRTPFVKGAFPGFTLNYDADQVTDVAPAEHEDSRPGTRTVSHPMSITASFERGARKTDAEDGEKQGHRDPIIGSRCRSMLICQPQIRTITVDLPCCCPEDDLLTNPKGLTVGDLLGLQKELAEEHKLCPHASPLERDDEGFAHVTVQFEGDVDLRDDDPVVVKSRAVNSDGLGDQRHQKMVGYTHAKCAGKQPPADFTLRRRGTSADLSHSCFSGRPDPNLGAMGSSDGSAKGGSIRR